MTTVRIKRCGKRRTASSDFYIDGGLFLCSDGVRKHWQVDVGVREIEVELHNGKPTKNAHRFRAAGAHWDKNIVIIPDEDEAGWTAETHGTYSPFNRQINEFCSLAESDSGWMEVRVIERT